MLVYLTLISFAALICALIPLLMSRVATTFPDKRFSYEVCALRYRLYSLEQQTWKNFTPCPSDVIIVVRIFVFLFRRFVTLHTCIACITLVDLKKIAVVGHVLCQAS